MPRKIDPAVDKILKECGLNARDVLWDCHGTWVMYHRAIEQVAAQQGIRFDPPIVLEANGPAKSVAICVVGHRDGVQEWSIGEAAPGNNKNNYPYAMAEKRAKDRVVLKLIGLHGLVYSEDEMPDERAPEPAQPQTTKASYVGGCKIIIRNAQDVDALADWWKDPERKKEFALYGLDQSDVDELKQAVIARRDELKSQQSVEA